MFVTMTAPTPNKPAVVYRAYDEDGRLLYVGCTVAKMSRLRAHRTSESAWWPLVHHITIHHYPDAQTAVQAESEAIYTEHPAHNVMSARVRELKWQEIEEKRLSGLTWPQVARAVDMSEQALARRVARMRKAGRSRV